jgi:hypothetical protein
MGHWTCVDDGEPSFESDYKGKRRAKECARKHPGDPMFKHVEKVIHQNPEQYNHMYVVDMDINSLVRHCAKCQKPIECACRVQRGLRMSERECYAAWKKGQYPSMRFIRDIYDPARIEVAHYCSRECDEILCKAYEDDPMYACDLDYVIQFLESR